MMNMLMLAAVVLIFFRVVIDLFSLMERDVFKDSENLINFDEVEKLTLDLWDKLIDQAGKEAELNPDIKCWIPAFKEMREGDIQLFLFLRNRLSKREMRHLLGTLSYSGVYSLTSEVFRENQAYLDVEGLKNTNTAISTCIGNFGVVKQKVLARAKSFCDTKVTVLKNFDATKIRKQQS